MFNRINSLKEKNVNFDIILDIGAHHGHWTDDCLKIYKDSNYYLFEAIDYNELNRFRNNNKFKVYNLILNEKEEDVEWYEMKNTGDSMFKELNKPFKDCLSIKKKSYILDKILENENFENKKILIKIDCQGAEIPILKGSTKILEKTDFIILEIPFFGQYNKGVPDFLEHIKFMDSIGFEVYDLLDNHYIYNNLMQIDIMFIKKNHYLKDLLIKEMEN